MSLSPWHPPTRRVIAVVLFATSGCTADTSSPARELDAAVQLGAEAGAGAAHEAGARADASSDANQPGAVSDAASSLPREGGREASAEDEDAGALDAAGLDAAGLDAGMQDAAMRDAAPDGWLGPDAGRFASAAIGAPPSYLATSGGSAACTQPARTTGFAPGGPAGARYPLFLYFVGTSGGANDASARYDCEAGKKVTEAMARRGFVALSVEYDNALLSILTNKLECLYVANNPDSLLAKACAMPNVDCAKGIATWGHSQGALLAHAARNYDARHRASWTTGYSGNEGAKLPYERLRVVNAENDIMNASIATLNKASGSNCPADGRSQCLRTDGSGWILVKKAECARNGADHCWFDKLSCVDSSEMLEPNWANAASTAPFALESNADWVAAAAMRPL